MIPYNIDGTLAIIDSDTGNIEQWTIYPYPYPPHGSLFPGVPVTDTSTGA